MINRHRAEVLSASASDPDAPPVSPIYHVDVDSKTDWNPLDLISAYDPLENTVLITRFAELQEVGNRADV